jgi:hypothetical protein
MQALENAGRRSWVKTYPLCPKAHMDETGGERKIRIQRQNGGLISFRKVRLLYMHTAQVDSEALQ